MLQFGRKFEIFGKIICKSKQIYLWKFYGSSKVSYFWNTKPNQDRLMCSKIWNFLKNNRIIGFCSYFTLWLSKFSIVLSVIECMCNRVLVRAHTSYVVAAEIFFYGTLFEHFLGSFRCKCTSTFVVGFDAIGDFIIRVTTDSLC